MSLLNNGKVTGKQIPQQVMNGINSVKGMMKQMRSLSNPMTALQQNPMFNQVMQMCNGQNPKDVFYSMCKKKGIDPEQFIQMLNS